MKHGTRIMSLRWVLSVVGLLAIGLIAGCDSGEDGSKKAAVIDACALLKQANPEALLGGPVDEGKELIHRQDAEATVSMCGYSARGPGNKSVSLQVMYTPKQSNPKTASSALQGQDFGSVGLETPTEVLGIGDVALSSSMPGAVVLQVFWKKHYRMKVSLSGLDDPAQVLEKAKIVARHVMEKL